MFRGTGVGCDPASGYGTVSKRPEKFVVPVVTLFLRLFHIGERSGNANQGVVDGLVDRLTVLGFEPVFFIPDINGRSLELDFR